MPTIPGNTDYDILQSISDTLNVIGPKVNQIAEASDPQTVQLNLTMAIIAAIASVLGVVFGFLGYLYAKRTAKNVERTNKKNRLVVSDRLIQVVYRKMSYIRALINDRSLISQNLLRSIYLPQFADCFILEDYRNDAMRYAHLLSLKNQMNKYDSVIDACIDKLDHQTSLSDRDLLDLLQTPIKVLIELYHINKDNSSNYADHLLSTIIDYHFKHVEDKDIASFKSFSFVAPKQDDTGVLLYSKLCKIGPLQECKDALSQKNSETFRNYLSGFMEKTSMDNYINLLEQSIKTDDKDNSGILAWLAAAWSFDSAIVQKQFESYYETTI